MCLINPDEEGLCALSDTNIFWFEGSNYFAKTLSTGNS